MTNAVSNTNISIRTTAATTSPMTSPDDLGSGVGSTGGDVVVSGGSCKTCLATTAISAIPSLMSRFCPIHSDTLQNLRC